MKILLTMFILITALFATSNQSVSQENSRLCKVFKLKVQMYKKHMRQDEYAYKTLDSYEQRAQEFCKKAH